MSFTPIPSDPFTRRLQKIGELITNGDIPNAALGLNEVAGQQPKDPRVYLLGMRLSEAKGEPDRAETDVRRAVSLNPMWIVSVTELAALLSRLGRHEEAMQHAKKAASLEPHNIDMLKRVIDIAHNALKFQDALGWLRRLSDLQPADSNLKLMIANDLRFVGNDAEALVVYDDLLAANPNEPVALLRRVQLLWALGRVDLAAKDSDLLRISYPANAEVQLWHGLTHGETLPTLPVEMVRSIFDAEAGRYNARRLHPMNYRLPEVMAALIKAKYPSLDIDLLELGSGTGLLGAALGKLQGALVGVEISLKMVEQAAPLELYDRVHTIDLLDALRATPDALYRVIAACDAFSYVGDLGQAIPDAKRILLPEGHFVFSCELAGEDEADWVLRPTLRFAHKRSHIEARCRAAGFDRVEVTETTLFNDLQDRPVQGFTVVAHKPAV